MVQVWNFDINQGEDFAKTLTYLVRNGGSETPIDITGCTIEGQIRKKPGANPLKCSFDVTILNQVTDTGKFTIKLANSVTSSLVVRTSMESQRGVPEWVYDIEITFPDLTKKRLMNGSIIVFAEVTA